METCIAGQRSLKTGKNRTQSGNLKKWYFCTHFFYTHTHLNVTGCFSLQFTANGVAEPLLKSRLCLWFLKPLAFIKFVAHFYTFFVSCYAVNPKGFFINAIVFNLFVIVTCLYSILIQQNPKHGNHNK